MIVSSRLHSGCSAYPAAMSTFIRRRRRREHGNDGAINDFDYFDYFELDQVVQLDVLPL